MYRPIGFPVVARNAAVSGLRISSVDGAAFIDNVDLTPTIANSKLLASGSVTRANMRTSAVDGKAFTDFSAGTHLTDNLGKYLIIRDSAGRELRGWIKSAGVAETLGAELLTEPNFDNGGAAWTTTTWTFGGNQALAGDISGTLRQTLAPAVNALLKWTVDVDSLSAGIITALASTGFGSFSAGVGSLYRNSVGSDNYGLYAAAATAAVNSCSIKQVLTPSATGAVIVSTKAGATENWEFKDANFAYNDASGYTYEVLDRDLSAFCDGNHLIEIYDASNRMLAGCLKEVGVAETLGAELLTEPNFDNGGAAWTTTVWTFGGNQALIGGDVGALRQSAAPPASSLVKYTADVDSLTSGRMDLFVGDANWGKSFPVGASSHYLLYGSAPVLVGLNSAGGGANGAVNSFSAKQVTAPSATGAVIVSAKGGAVENFKAKNASFTYNAASYGVIIKKMR